MRITKPHSPPRGPLSTPGIPSERQGRDAGGGIGELPSSLDSWGWVSSKVPFCSVIRGRLWLGFEQILLTTNSIEK